MTISILPKIQLADIFRTARSGLSNANIVNTFSQAREGIFWLFRRLSRSSRNHVIVPASLCFYGIEPIIRAGFNIEYCALDAQMKIDLDDLRNRISKNTAAIFLPHYFGYPQPMKKLIEICRVENLLLFEDCAQCLYEENNPDAVGKRGDYSIYSLRKFDAVPDGAVLMRNSCVSNLDNVSEMCRSGNRQALNTFFRSWVSNFDMRSKRKLVGSLPRKSDEEIHYSQNIKAQLVGNYDLVQISDISKHLYRRTDHELTRKSRRRNYRMIIDHVKNHTSAKPLFENFPDNFVPYNCPIKTADPYFAQLKFLKHGIATEISVNRPFHTIQQILNRNEKFPIIDQLADSVLSLPCHQRMSFKQLDKLISVMTDVL